MECLSQDVQPVSSRWASQYRSKLASAREAVGLVRSGDRVWVHRRLLQPGAAVHALVARAAELRDVELVHLMTLGAAPSADPRYAASFRHCALFTGANVRQAVNEGRADFVPVHLSDIPRLITTGRIPIDVAFIHVSPPDEHGFCSFGVGVDVHEGRGGGGARRHRARQRPHAAHARRLASSTSRASATPSRSTCPSSSCRGRRSSATVARAIGELVAELVEDGSTLQMGIGEMPDAVLSRAQGQARPRASTRRCSRTASWSCSRPA